MYRTYGSRAMQEQLPICPWRKIDPCIFHTSHVHVGRMDGQIFAPAISALPPSVVVVVGQCRSNCRGAKTCPAADGLSKVCFRFIFTVTICRPTVRLNQVFQGFAFYRCRQGIIQLRQGLFDLSCGFNIIRAKMMCLFCTACRI